jgi:UDP-N-acetyl-D-mannosaminuronate dehydrogenase
VVICTDHSAFDYDQMVSKGTLIVDSRNALKGRKDASIFRL